MDAAPVKPYRKPWLITRIAATTALAFSLWQPRRMKDQDDDYHIPLALAFKIAWGLTK